VTLTAHKNVHLRAAVAHSLVRTPVMRKTHPADKLSGNANAARKPVIAQNSNRGITACSPLDESAQRIFPLDGTRVVAHATASARPIPQYIARYTC
jgi:hypothetical protein